MAICNLFRQFSKNTGNFLMFEQYASDLTKCYVQHDSYDVIPSKFVALNIDYSKLSLQYRQPSASSDLNEVVPAYLQNYYENGCAWLKSSSVSGNEVLNQQNWTPDDWSAKTSSNILWNALYHGGLISISKYDEGWVKNSADLSAALESFNVINEVQYVGKIDIHSYEERDGIGYSELYCYVPNEAVKTLYEVTNLTKKQLSYQYKDEYVMGYDANGENILGILPINVSAQQPAYYYNQDFTFAGYEVDPGSSNEIEYEGESVLRYANEYSKKYYPNNPVNNYFKFNTIVILYDIVVRDANGNISTLHKDIPMGMYLTGLINSDGSVDNEVIKYEECKDAYNSGTSYGLRICTRYTSTPNSTTIKSIELDLADQYGGFSQAMNKMAESQEKMDEILNEVVSNSQMYKDHLAIFKNGRTNCPYIRKVGDEYIWFINGKSTGIPANGNKGDNGRDGTVLELIEKDGTYYWQLDGVLTNVRAEGRDGIAGPQGPEGPQGKDGTTPTIYIRQSSNIATEYMTWWINGVDTGVLAKARSPQIVEYNGHKYWSVDGVRTEYRVDVESGVTPSIVNGADGHKYWWIGNSSTSVRADGVDGKSIHVTQTTPYVNNGTVYIANLTSDVWNAGDVVLYAGVTNPGYNKYDLYKIVSFNSSVSRWKMEKLGNIGAKVTDVVSNISLSGSKNKMKVNVSDSSGSVQSFNIKTPSDPAVLYSTRQRRFVNISDTAYYWKENHRKVYVEIPYTYVIAQDGSQYTVKIRIPSQYRTLPGVVMIRPTDICVPNTDEKLRKKELAFSTSRRLVNGRWVKRATVLHQSMYCTPPRYGDLTNYYVNYKPTAQSAAVSVGTISHMDVDCEYNENDAKFIFDGIVTIWEGLSESEVNAIKRSYNISKHIGKVHVYVELNDIIKNPEVRVNSIKYILSDIRTTHPGILFYDSVNSRWATSTVNNPVSVKRHKKTVDREWHYSSTKTNKKVDNIDDFWSTYSNRNVWVRVKGCHTSGDSIIGPFAKKMYWRRCYVNPHSKKGSRLKFWDYTSLSSAAQNLADLLYSNRIRGGKVSKTKPGTLPSSRYIYVGGQTEPGGKIDIYKITLAWKPYGPKDSDTSWVSDKKYGDLNSRRHINVKINVKYINTVDNFKNSL